VERDESHEYEPDLSFECDPITLENGVTSGTFDSGEEEGVISLSGTRFGRLDYVR
jgi:hypothetical protein